MEARGGLGGGWWWFGGQTTAAMVIRSSDILKLLEIMYSLGGMHQIAITTVFGFLSSNTNILFVTYTSFFFFKTYKLILLNILQGFSQIVGINFFSVFFLALVGIGDMLLLH